MLIFSQGHGTKLQTKVAQIVRTVIDKLSQRVGARSATTVGNEAMHHPPQRTPSITEAYGTAVHNIGVVTGAPTLSNEVKHEAATVYPVPEAHSVASTQAPYGTTVPASHFPQYPDAPSSDSAPYANTSYVQPTYSAAEQIPTQLPISGGQAQQPSAPIYVPPGPVPYYPADLQNTPTHEWLRWGHATMSGFPNAAPQEFMASTANTLMTMSGRTSSMNGSQIVAAAQDPSSQWPMNVYNVGHNGGNPGG
jgi:hypothetical protein